MVTVFKPRVKPTRGIDVESPAAQAADISELINASYFAFDGLSNTATFNVEAEGVTRSIIVAAGQVVSVTDDVISVQPRDEFYNSFEAAT